MKEKIIKPEIAAAISAALITACLLMPGPVLGVADNGDFGRIMGSTGLEYMSEDHRDRYFGYVNREYLLKDSVFLGGGYLSSEILLVEAAKLFNRMLLPGKNTFDIRFLAAIYICILLIALYLIARYGVRDYPPAGWVLAALLVFMFTDIGYISYFNSLYGEAVSFTSLLLLAGILLYISRQDKPKPAAFAAFFAAAAALTTAKVQYIPLGIILAAYTIRLALVHKSISWRVGAVCFSVFLTAVSCISYLSIPEGIRVCNKYQSLFFGVLKDSPDPAADLAEFGLGQEYSVLAGTNYFMNDYPLDIKDPAFVQEINSKVNPFRITHFYLKHPSRLYRKLLVASENGFGLLQGFGNYEKAEGIEFGKTAGHLQTWSRVRDDLLPHSLPFIAAFTVLYFTAVLYFHRKRKGTREKLVPEALMLIGIISVVQFFVPIIGDGEADLGKHLFLFNTGFDMMLAAGISWCAYTFIRTGGKMVGHICRAKRYPRF